MKVKSVNYRALAHHRVQHLKLWSRRQHQTLAWQQNKRNVQLIATSRLRVDDRTIFCTKNPCSPSQTVSTPCWTLTTTAAQKDGRSRTLKSHSLSLRPLTVVILKNWAISRVNRRRAQLQRPWRAKLKRPLSIRSKLPWPGSVGTIEVARPAQPKQPSSYPSQLTTIDDWEPNSSIASPKPCLLATRRVYPSSRRHLCKWWVWKSR